MMNSNNNNNDKEISNPSTIINFSFLVIIIGLLIPITLISTYTITETTHPDSMVIPFISSSINNAPESCIGGYGISISSFIMVIVIFIKYLIVKGNILEKIPIEQQNLLNKLKFNKYIAATGIISSFSVNGVASFQYKNAHIVHLLFAASFFINGFIYMLLQTIIDGQVSDIPKSISNLRKSLVVISLLFIPYVILQFSGNMIIKNMSAVFEITAAGCIFTYMITYYSEFSKMNFNIECTKNLNKNTSNNTNHHYQILK